MYGCVCVCVCVCVCACMYQIDKIFRNYLLSLRNGLSQIFDAIWKPVLLMLDTDNWLSVRISNYYYGVQGFIEIPSMY